MYFVGASPLWEESWHPVPAGYAARSIAVQCPPECHCGQDPRMQLAVARAIIAADRDRALRSRENYERRLRARQMREAAW